MKKIILMFLACHILLLISCAQAIEKNDIPRMPRNALALPLVRQSTHYSCGAAVMLSVLNYWQKFDGDESSLFPLLGTTSDNGTDPLMMERLARQMGLEVEYRLRSTWDDLMTAVGNGATVIVDYQAWHEDDQQREHDYSNMWEDGHYSVVVAIDQQHIYLMDPSTMAGYGYLKRDDFLKRWHDYEVRQGQRVENWQLALIIRGKNGAQAYPRPLTYIE